MVTSNPYNGISAVLASSPQRHGVAVTKSDTVPLHDPAFGTGAGVKPEVAVALFVQGGGTLVFYDASDVPAERTMVVPDNFYLIGAVTFVRAATTATGITASFLGSRP